jgi:uncharacterized membrane protein YfhO
MKINNTVSQIIENNKGFMCVQIPERESEEVEFRYYNSKVIFGLMISAVSLFCFVIIIFLKRKLI